MDDLLGKLNVLVRARLRGRTGDGTRDDRDAVRPHSVGRRGPDLDREIQGLRQSLDDAFLHEDRLRMQIRELQDEADRQDLAADAALKRGQTDVARQAVEAMQRAQRRMAMVEADLAEHQRAAQELLQRVNLLESVVAESRDAGQAAPPQGAPDAAELPAIDRVLDDMRSTIDQYSRIAEARESAPATDAESQAVDDEMDRRIARLSRR